MEAVKTSSATVEYLLHEQVSRVLENLLVNVNRRAEPIQQQFDQLDQQHDVHSQTVEDLEKVLRRTRQFLDELPTVITESVVEKRANDRTAVSVGSSAWLDSLVDEFYSRPLSPAQQAFALNALRELASTETRVIKMVGEAEMKRRQLVTYPLWEEWKVNADPTLELAAKGLLMGAESGTYFLTPTGRLIFKYLKEYMG